MLLHCHEKNWGREIAGCEAHSTNNRMELMAAIAGLEALTRECEVTIYSDSKYVVDGITSWIHNWRKNDWKNGTVKNQDLWQRLSEAEEAHQVTWNWVRGHSGNEGNERADLLAETAARCQRPLSRYLRLR